jgi:hypothetical protein
VRTDRCSVAAICLLVSPDAASNATSRSRAVRQILSSGEQGADSWTAGGERLGAAGRRDGPAGLPLLRQCRRSRPARPAGRTRLTAYLHLDADVRIPDHVVHETERRASMLLRLTR